MNRHALTDAHWERLRPLLPPRSTCRGRPRVDDRLVVEGILWRVATGAPWRDLPERFGPWRTVYSRFRRWQAAGVWEHVMNALQADADARGELDRRHHFLDGTTIRAHAHAAGATKKGGGDQELGRSRGGLSTKLHLRTEGGGKPLTFVLTAGQRHEATQVATLLERGAVRRPSGQQRLRPDRIVGDKGYTGAKIRRYLRRRGIGVVIPRLTIESRRGVRFDRTAYRTRNRIERTINRLNGFRAVATRYDKRADMFQATVTLACIRL